MLSKELNILFITGSRIYPFQIGGTEIATYYLVKELTRQGCNVHVITGRLPKDKEEESKKISFKIEELKTGDVPKLRGILYFIGSFVKTLLLRKKIDIIHIQPLFPTGLLGLLLGRITKKPTVVWARGADIEVYSRFKYLIKWVIRNATSVIALSYSQKLKMETLTGRQVIKVIPNGVWIPDNKDQQIRSFLIHLKEFAPNLPSSHIVNNLNDKTKIVMYVGRLEDFKGIHYLLRAIPNTLREIPNTLFLFIGDGAKRKTILKFSSTLHITDNVLFIKEIPHKHIFSFYRGADIFIYPTLRGQGMSNAVLEAMASGLPVIASRVGGIPDIIKNGKNGLLINPKNPEQITHAILKLLRSSDLRKIYGQNAKDFILDLSWENIAKRIIKIYRTLIRGI